MPNRDQSLRVYRDSWSPEHVALLCGIANAGGGALLIASGSSSRARDMRRLRKPFEQIPQIAQRELGIICTTQPMLDGAFLRLEISVPKAPADTPLRYNGLYRFYDEESERNLTLSLSEIKERRGALEKAPSSAPAPTQQSAPKGAIDSTQDLIEAFGDLVEKLAATVEGTTVVQEGSTFTVSFGTNTPAKAATAQPPKQPAILNRTSIVKTDPEASEFSQRSVAAANKLDLTSTDEYVLRVLHANGRATAAHIATLLGVSESTVRRSIKQLKTHALIERVGSNKAGYWRVLD